MTHAPVYDIEPKIFWDDPYPGLKAMRATAPVVFVPQLGAHLITRHRDIFENEKIIDVFSSVQPNGLMTKLMGENMMRKDGDTHMAESKAIFPTVSPKTVKLVWKQAFEAMALDVLTDIATKGEADMVRDIGQRLAGEALKILTGLTTMTWQNMDRVSQGMIDGIANYSGDPDVEAHCHDCTADIERHIQACLPELRARPDHSLLSVLAQAGASQEQIYANGKLAISGGQNEVRDVIAGLTWAMLVHPEQHTQIMSGAHTWMDAFDVYTRWMSPIGMSPREVARPYDLQGIALDPGSRVFLMFGSGNRDETVFERPDVFDMSQSSAASMAFGAGPHFCAGAWASRCLVAEVAVPMIFDRLKGLKLAGDVPFGGRAFRGPLSMPGTWQATST